MARIPEEEIAEIRRKADIADIIGRYIPVQKQGREFKAVCPFHDDHDPSLHINTEHQFYKCFVCNAGGNVFTFVQNYEHVSFPEAVGKVAELIGHPLSVNTSAAPQKVDPEKARYYKVLEEAISFTCYEINSEEASAAKSISMTAVLMRMCGIPSPSDTIPAGTGSVRSYVPRDIPMRTWLR